MLELRNVSKRFRSGRGEIRALEDISWQNESGSGVVLLGRSGSGKTTLLNCLGTLEMPDSGTINFNGENLCGLSAMKRAAFRRRQVGFVFQAGNLLPWLTVAENIAMPLELNGVSSGHRKARLAELLAMLGMSGYERAMAVELSAGESQRVAFGRAIAHRPKLLLADEPTANLDSENGRQLVRLMLDCCEQQGAILVLTTHDPELQRLAGTVITLKDGQMENRI